VTAKSLPSGFKESGNMSFLKLFDLNVLPLKPSTQVGHQPNLLPPNLFGVALFNKKSSEAVQMRPQWTTPQTFEIFRFTIEMMGHECLLLLLVLKSRRRMTPGLCRVDKTKDR